MKKTIFFFQVFFFVFIFNFRYFRLYSPLNQISYFIYGYIIILLGFSIFYMLFQKSTQMKITFYATLFFILGSISWIAILLKYNFQTQIQYFVETIAFVPLIFYFKRKSNLPKLIDNIIIYHTLFSGVLLISEFYLTNYLDLHFLSQHTLWALSRDAADAPTQYGYSEDYPIFGKLARPWGFMALPQSSGVYYAAASIFLAFKLKSRRNLLLIISLFIGIASLFFSGSKTGYLIFVIYVFYLLYSSSKHNFIYFVCVIVFSGLSGVLIFGWFASKFFDGLGEKGVGGWSENYNFLLQNFENFKISWLLGDGSNHDRAEVIRTDWSIYNLFMSYGPFLFVVFLLFLLNVFKIVINHFKRDFFEYRIILIVLLLGTIHYDSLTRFPLNFLFILTVSLFVNKYERKFFSAS